MSQNRGLPQRLTFLLSPSKVLPALEKCVSLFWSRQSPPCFLLRAFCAEAGSAASCCSLELPFLGVCFSLSRGFLATLLSGAMFCRGQAQAICFVLFGAGVSAWGLHAGLCGEADGRFGRQAPGTSPCLKPRGWLMTISHVREPWVQWMVAKSVKTLKPWVGCYRGISRNQVA